eukprot:TRINITY_DN3750_c0_g1_i2.p1 TRINITY_DN3750_c0_g1~~TRINITY_DN3750_c0_g1_i2.p1  ORF type:complete len:168 (+),score=47.60 TRINITY_DN3750_c0_g1_i2:38-541(+)
MIEIDTITRIFSLLYGVGVKEDIKKAEEICIKKAEKGDEAAIGLLFFITWENKEEKKKIFEMFWDFYQKLLQQGNVKKDLVGYCLDTLGQCYKYGYGVKRNNEKAKEYFEQAADMDNSVALFHLAQFYDLGAKIDLKKAAELYEKSAKMGYHSAMFEIGQFFESGRG